MGLVVKMAQSQEMKFVTTLQTIDAWNKSKTCVLYCIVMLVS